MISFLVSEKLIFFMAPFSFFNFDEDERAIQFTHLHKDRSNTIQFQCRSIS